MIIILTLFAFAGLLGGFTLGAFTRIPNKQQPTTQHNNTVVTNQMPTATPTPGVNIMVVGVGCPNVTDIAINEIADSNTPYKVTAQVIDKSIENKSLCGAGKPLSAPDMLCKIWLTKDEGSLKKGLGDAVKPENVSNPFPGEETGALLFEGGNMQTQPCNQAGATTWTYKLSSTLKSGTYFLAILTDWQGKRFNYKWFGITIKGQSGNGQ